MCNFKNEQRNLKKKKNESNNKIQLTAKNWSKVSSTHFTQKKIIKTERMTKKKKKMLMVLKKKKKKKVLQRAAESLKSHVPVINRFCNSWWWVTN